MKTRVKQARVTEITAANTAANANTTNTVGSANTGENGPNTGAGMTASAAQNQNEGLPTLLQQNEVLQKSIDKKEALNRISVVGEKNTPKSSKSCGCLSNVEFSDFIVVDNMSSFTVPSSSLVFSLVIEIPTVSGVGKWCVSTVSSHSTGLSKGPLTTLLFSFITILSKSV